MRDAQDLVAIVTNEQDGLQETGRFYFAPHPQSLRLRDREGQVVPFVLIPYPTPADVPAEKRTYRTLEERNGVLKEAFESNLRVLLDGVTAGEPAVLVSHIAVRGSTTDSSHWVDDGTEILLEPSVLPTSLAYIALGRPQEVLLGVPHIRYAGSIERMDYGGTF